MARLPRLVIPKQPLHIMHRGNNRQNIFENDDDMMRLKEDLAQALSSTDCLCHAYVFMTNHFHLLVTPATKQDLSRFMQMLTNRYVRYFNASRKRTGTIWEGRFKSCLVDSDSYLFTLHKYIEMNPLRAKMVNSLKEYRWSSFHYNAYGQVDKLVTPHPLYLELGDTFIKRTTAYQYLFNELDGKQIEQVRTATQRGEVLGSDLFHDKISQLVSRPTRLREHGGDRKSEDYRNQVG